MEITGVLGTTRLWAGNNADVSARSPLAFRPLIRCWIIASIKKWKLRLGLGVKSELCLLRTSRSRWRVISSVSKCHCRKPECSLLGEKMILRKEGSRLQLTTTNSNVWKLNEKKAHV